MRNQAHFRDGAYDYDFPPVTKERQLLVSFDDIYVDLQFVKNEVHELEDLVLEMLDDQDDLEEEVIDKPSFLK